ncbi:MAG: hypothetical protein R3Y49_06470 [Rikenellaceae bacterium]
MKVPSSKSYTCRALLCALLAQGESRVRGVSWCDDELAARRVAQQFSGAKIDVGESGFLARAVGVISALKDSDTLISGSGTLLKRKLGLKELLGDRISGDNVPFVVRGGGLSGGEIELDGSGGSQVLSGLLLASPYALSDTTITVKELKSREYIDMTLSVMHQFGVTVQRDGYSKFHIKCNQKYRGCDYSVEGDWSAASYFLVWARLRGKDIVIENLNPESLQPDRAIVRALESAKGGGAIEFDATHCPDLFTALVPLCASLSGVSKIKGCTRLYSKESNRAEVLQREFGKFGVNISLDGDTMSVEGHGKSLFSQQRAIDPSGDHRIAMATAIMGDGVEIMYKEVVSKSFRDFFKELG